MQASSLYLIATVEIAALLLLVCGFLVFQNRSLRQVLKKLQSRMELMLKDLKAARATSNNSAQEKRATTEKHLYKNMLNQQLEQVREHHQTLKPGQDIVLDIDPETPMPRRVAALRYALLLAEKEATSKHPNGTADWHLLQRKYEQIFNFHATYEPPPTSNENHEEIESLRTELSNTKKRINNLERFKALYFDLEEKWEACKGNAHSHYKEISELTAGTENAAAIDSALKAYHSSYNDINALIEDGVEGGTILAANKGDSTGEIRHLRAVAADQHKIITELQRKLHDASSEEQRAEIVNDLKGQLQKQVRFVQESETCIQLLEDELNTAHKELEQLRTRLRLLPQIKTQLKTLRDQNDDHEMQMYSLKSENRRLMSKLQGPTSEPNEVARLKKEISELETRYAELEEKFLDLKLQ